MKNVLGNNLTLTLFGESRGEAVGGVLDGLPAGIAVSAEAIKARMDKRRPGKEWASGRKETDAVTILSGVKDGVSIGTPIAFLIPNEDAKGDGDDRQTLPRPGHADYPATVRAGGAADLRGGGHFSGRLTAPIVAAAAIVEGALNEKGIRVGAHLLALGGASDREFLDTGADFDLLDGKEFPALDGDAERRMKDEIGAAKDAGDSIGGIVGVAVTGLPVGVGEPFFDSIESVISHAVFSVPAVKGVEFGAGFALAAMRGSEANDRYIQKDGEVTLGSNAMGGVLGGLSDGMPVTFRVAVKPTPSIAKEQKTLDLSSMKEVSLSVGGRNDPAVAVRAVEAIRAATVLAVADLYITRYGAVALGEKR